MHAKQIVMLQKQKRYKDEHEKTKRILQRT